MKKINQETIDELERIRALFLPLIAKEVEFTKPSNVLCNAYKEMEKIIFKYTLFVK